MRRELAFTAEASVKQHEYLQELLRSPMMARLQMHMSKSKTFVLIHGSWHGGWAWQAVIRCLSEQGYGAHAPTLAGHGPGAMRLGVTHQQCGDSVVTYIRQRGLEDVILVGHSFGGTVVQKVAEQVPNRIAPDCLPGCAHTRGQRMRPRYFATPTRGPSQSSGRGEPGQHNVDSLGSLA